MKKDNNSDEIPTDTDIKFLVTMATVPNEEDFNGAIASGSLLSVVAIAIPQCACEYGKVSSIFLF